MAALIERAATAPERALALEASELDDVRRLFGDEEGLLLALRHRWVTALTAKLDQAAYDDVPSEQVRAELAAAQPGLRALLDVAARRSVRLRSLERGEQRILDYLQRAEPEAPTGRRVGRSVCTSTDRTVGTTAPSAWPSMIASCGDPQATRRAWSDCSQ